MDAAPAPDRHLADSAAGGRLMKGPRPSADIGLRDAQTSDARATRVRQLATPSWLSTRPKPVIQRRAAPAHAARETVARTASSTWSSYRGRKFSVFLACAPCWCRHDAGRFRGNARARRRAHCCVGLR
jgi:hypothetical protein